MHGQRMSQWQEQVLLIPLPWIVTGRSNDELGLETRLRAWSSRRMDLHGSFEAVITEKRKLRCEGEGSRE
jgi:hypothetical protein